MNFPLTRRELDPEQQSVAEEFDAYDGTYNDTVNKALSFTRQKVQSFVRAKAEDLLSLINKEFERPALLRILDVGCGIGNYHPFLVGRAGEIHGIDISQSCVVQAALRNPTVNYSTYDGIYLPYPDEHFDLTFCICVVHHVPPKKWTPFFRELNRVTKKGGLTAIYEHNPRHPLTRMVVRDCPFDRNAVLISAQETRSKLIESGFVDVSTRSVLTLPPWAWTAGANRLLSFLPFGTQYRAIGRARS